jgi:enoyl-CoA hydratase
VGVGDPVTYTIRGDLAIARMSREHGNAINRELLEGLVRACGTAADDDRVRGLLLAAGGKLFCPGLDLQELIELDRPAMTRFVALLGECIRSLYTFEKPLVAAIGGHAVAGGCVLALTADWRVLRRGAVIGLNEVRVGVPLPYGVAQILRESVGREHLDAVALYGRNYSDDEALACGLAHELGDGDGFEARCLERLAELAEKNRPAFALTKRWLRAAATARLEMDQAGHDAAFVDAWFSPGAQERIRTVVAGLRTRQG